jgi:hypothetical protein
MRWGVTDGKEFLFRCDLPWDSDADSFAQVFQSMMEAYGFSPRTITEYVESSLMCDDWRDEKDENADQGEKPAKGDKDVPEEDS